jgi:hypothetical protein
MMTKEKPSVPVSLRALLQRINRKLAAQEECLKATRGERGRHDLGDYYIVDVRRNFVVATHQDPETLGRELGALRPWEAVR